MTAAIGLGTSPVAVAADPRKRRYVADVKLTPPLATTPPVFTASTPPASATVAKFNGPYPLTVSGNSVSTQR